MVAREPAERMDDNYIERGCSGRRHIEKPLQLRAAIVGAARAGFDELNDDVPATAGAKCQGLTPLVRYGEIGFSLAARRYAQVQCRPHGDWRL